MPSTAELETALGEAWAKLARQENHRPLKPPRTRTVDSYAVRIRDCQRAGLTIEETAKKIGISLARVRTIAAKNRVIFDADRTRRPGDARHG